MSKSERKAYWHSVLLLGLLACASVLIAQDSGSDPYSHHGYLENDCRDPIQVREGVLAADDDSFSLARIVGPANMRVPFIRDDDNNNMDERLVCPTLDRKKCPWKLYLRPNDIVVKEREYREFSCVWTYKWNGGSEWAWVPTSNVKVIPTNAHPALGDWVGKWKYFLDSHIEISVKDGKLHVEGGAYWPGRDVPPAHDGEINIEGTPDGNVLKATDEDNEDCKVELILLGKYLVVGDNFHCGGVNVTFDGVYRRRPAPAKSAASREKRAEQMAARLLLALEGETETPPILQAAFQRQPLARKGWEAMTPGQRRRQLLFMFYCETVEARERRAARVVEEALRVAKRRSSPAG